LVIDKVDTHQRLAGRPLRSLKPIGVIQAGIDPDRLNFVPALRLLHDGIPEFQMVAPDQLTSLYTRLLRDIADGRLPARRLRSNPRVVKRKMFKFRLKRPKNDRWPQRSLSFPHSVALPAAPDTAALFCPDLLVYEFQSDVEQTLI